MPIDYSKYPPNWKKEIVPRIIERAGNCCEECGVENKKELWSIGLWVKEGTRYKLRKIWVESGCDMYRLRKLSGQKPKLITVVLTIAHLDHDEENHDVKDDRLKAMCQWCHLNYDAKEKIRRINAKSPQQSIL